MPRTQTAKTAQRITKATAAQWREVERIRDFWINDQTTQFSREEIASVVDRMWADMGLEAPLTFRFASPLATVMGASIVSSVMANGGKLYQQLYQQLDQQLYQQLDQQLGQQPSYVSLWWRAWAGWYEGGKALGVEFDSPKYELFRDFTRRVPFIVPYKNAAFVSQNPVEVHWQEGRLHCDDGPSVRFEDGYSLYTLDGVQVDEQIVMRPQSQTLEQIRDEQNAEIKRIRIERLGWQSYLRATKAKVIEHVRNEVSQTDETLMECDGMRVVVCACPSTARTYALEVPKQCRSVEQAQNYLSGDRARRIIGAS